MPVTIPTDADYLLFPFTDDPDENKRISESLHVHKLLGGEIEEAEFDETYEKKEIDADTYAFWMLNVKEVSASFISVTDVLNSEQEFVIKQNAKYKRLKFKDYTANPEPYVSSETDAADQYSEYTQEVYVSSGESSPIFHSTLQELSSNYLIADMPMPFSFVKQRFDKDVNPSEDRIKYVRNEHENHLIIAPARLNGHYNYGMTRVFQRSHWYLYGVESGDGFFQNDVLASYAFFLSFVYYKEKFYAIYPKYANLAEPEFGFPLITNGAEISKESIRFEYEKTDQYTRENRVTVVTPLDTFF
jgi:hypothetical protein